MNILAWRDKSGKQVKVDGKLSWRLRWDTKDAGTGKRKNEYDTCHGSRREAEKQWIEHEAEIRAGGVNYVQPAKDLLADYLPKWLERRRADLRPTTWGSYDQMARTHVKPALGATKLADLTAATVESWVADMLAGRGPEGHPVGARTAAYARTVLRIALQDAVRLGLLKDNPVDRTRPPKQAPRHVEAFTPQQAMILFERAASTRFRSLFEFAFYTGMRRGEILALRWDDVNMDGAMLVVRRSRVKVGGKRRGQEQAPKTAAGERAVALPGLAVDALRRQWAAQAKDKLKAGPEYNDQGFVFATMLGNPLGPDDISRDFRRLRDSAPCPGCGRHTSPDKSAKGSHSPMTHYRCRCHKEWDATGLPQLPFHALRHSAATIQIASGVPVEVVSKRLGHRRISTTLDTYGHLLPEANTAAASKVDDFMAKVMAGEKGH